jgi:hypothetical protein
LFIEKSGDVAPRPCQAINEAAGGRVPGTREYDRHSGAHLPDSIHICATGGHNHVGRERNQFRRVSAIAIGIARTPAVIDCDVAAFGPAQFLQALPKRSNSGLSKRIAFDASYQHTDAPHLLGLLRAGGEWPSSRCGCQTRDKFAPPHWSSSRLHIDSLSRHIGVCMGIG